MGSSVHVSEARVGLKDLYDLGEVPPLGHVPKNMHAWVIRRERHGQPNSAMQLEVVPTPKVGPDEVLVHVMAAGINYNSIWAAMGKPVSVFDVHKHEYHVPGSDASASCSIRLMAWSIKRPCSSHTIG